jgi:hypothetical protein
MDKICWITLTHGRKEIFYSYRKSWYKKLKGNIVKEIIIDDSGDLNYFNWLKITYKNATVVKVGDVQMGFAEAMTRSFTEALNSECDYIFHLEEDFFLISEVNLDSLVGVFKENSMLSQIVLKRNNVFEPEFLHGDLLNSFNTIGTENINGIEITKQDVWWSCNPNIYPVKISKIGWIKEDDSEKKFSKKVFDSGYISAYLGTNKDKNICHHPVKNFKTGIGY